MSPPFLVGMLIAWSVAQLALGGFFVIAYAFGRREQDYLVFGLLCFALTVTTLGIIEATSADTTAEWLSATSWGHVGVVAATSFNLHFALRYAVPRSVIRIRLVWAVYASAALFELGNVIGWWWRPGSARIESVPLFGSQYVIGSASPTLLALLFYAMVGVGLLASQSLLFLAHRRGRREALIACAGGLFVCGAGVNDILLETGVRTHTVFLLPHAFMLYAFAVASTLVLRYRLTAGELAQAESSLALAAEELRVSHAELEHVQGELVTKEQLATVGALAAAIAHEVRNPLAVIMNAVASLRRQEVADDDRQMLLGIVDEETARLNRLVTDLLRFARPADVQRGAVELEELVEIVRPPACAECEIDVSKLAGAPARIAADAELLRVALENLLENACQASGGKGRISVTISGDELEHEPAARIAVRDWGGGMSKHVLERAGDPFFTTRPSGTGLGLPIVQRIVRAHRGRVDVESREGEGTTVSLVLPARAPQPETTSETAEGRA